MQDGWQRRHAHLDLDCETLRAMFAPFAPGHEIETAEPLAGGLANANYRVTLAGLADPLVARVFTRDAAACQKEVALWRLVYNRVPAAAFEQGVIALLYFLIASSRWCAMP